MNAPLTESVRRAMAEVTLDDRWTLDRGRAYMSGTQALLRLSMLQRQRDVASGLPARFGRPDRLAGQEAPGAAPRQVPLRA
jgi:hypothetical protein